MLLIHIIRESNYMKARVKYFDYELNEMVEKNCEDFYYTTSNMFEFEFMPVDDPVRIYKSVVIIRPKIMINYRKEYNELNLMVDGFQYTKNGYSLTTTTITIKEDENE
jgi:hypothetical protein